MEIFVSLSALPPSLYRKYVKGWKPNPTLLKLFEQISGKRGRKAMRIYIDAKTDNVIKTITDNVKPPKIVVDELSAKGVEIVDYVAGTGKDKHGRVIRLGRSLKSADAKKAFDSDPQRKSLVNATRNHQLICISMHPYDIAGMSTDRGWSSCMNLVDGSNKKFVGNDINQGTLIAYLIDASDKNINKPVARCLAKPYFERAKGQKTSQLKVGGKVNAMYLVEYAYPDSTMPFVHVLQEWFDEHINPNIAASERKGIYELAPKLYADKRERQYVYDLEGPLARGDLKTFVDLVVNHSERLLEEVDADDFKVVSDAAQRYPQVLSMLADAGWKTFRWGNLAGDLIKRGKAQDFVNLSRSLIRVHGINSRPAKVMWEKATRTLESTAQFLSVLPEDEKQSFVVKNIGEIVPYTHARNDMAYGGYPKALAQIWTLVKSLPDAEEHFWRAASRINNDDVATADVEEEYDTETELLNEVISPALISLGRRVGESPVSLEQLNKYKSIVPDLYFKYASKVLNGMVPLVISRWGAQRYEDLVSDLAKETGARAFIVSYVMEDTKFSRYGFDALDTLYPNYNIINPRAQESTVLIKSSDSAEKISSAVFGLALSEYRKAVIPLIMEEASDDDDSDIPDMSEDDEGEWEDEWQDAEEDDKEQEEDFDLTAEDGEFDDSDWDEEFDENGIPYM